MAKEIVGKVITAKMQKTVVVSVEKKFRHPQYNKVLIRHKKYKAHIEGIHVKAGDSVKIVQSRPFSKETAFVVTEKVGKKA